MWGVDMKINKADVVITEWDNFYGVGVRTITLKDGRVWFSAYDIAVEVLGIVSPAKLYNAVDPRSKAEAVLSFVEDYNPQRYNLVNIDGLQHMVYRAKNCPVNRLDFINWAKSRGERD